MGKCTQYLVIAFNEKDNVKKNIYIFFQFYMCVCVCITGSRYCIPETEHCKSAISTKILKIK